MQRLKRGPIGSMSLGLGAIAIMAIVWLSASGGLVYKYNLNNSKKTAAVTTSQGSSGTTTQPTSTVDISQWGVQLSLTSTTSSMYYYINPQLPNVAYLSLKTISDIAPNCAADANSLGAISRLTAAQHQSALSDPSQGVAGTTEVGSYWYAFSTPQSTCFNSTNDSTVSQAIPSYTPGTISSTFNTISAD